MEGPQSCVSTEGKQDETKNNPGEELVNATTASVTAAVSSTATAITGTATTPLATTTSLTTVVATTPSSSPSHPKNEVGPEMLPSIQLVPVQLGPSGKVTLPKKENRGRRPKVPPGLSGLSPQRRQFVNRRLNKIKRLGPSSRGGRGLKISGLDEKSLMGEDVTMEEEFPNDDVFISPAYQEKWPGRVCGFCCLGEMSQLGQGELTRFEATSGYTLPEKLTPAYEALDSPNKKLKPNQSPRDKGKSPRKQVGEALPEPVDEICQVGHVEQPSISTLFLPTGQCFAHYMCALWSSGVELSGDDTISAVDKAVVTGANQRCYHCNRFGATIPCKASGCSHFYHLPCAMYDAAPMDLKSVAMLCSEHSEQRKDLLVDMECMVCESPNSPENMLFCSTCGNHYHGNCLDPHISVNYKTRTGWQCPDCKTCQMCRQPGDEIVCGLCDKPYHVVCARTFGLSISKTGWKCKTCRVCGDCGSRTPGNGTSSRWHSNFTVCDSCYQLRNKGLACPICRKAYRAIMQKTLAQCGACKKHVHKGCEEDADLHLIKSKKTADPSYEYVCATCRKPPAPSPNQSPHISRGEDSLDGTQESSLHSEDSNDSNLMCSEGNKAEDISPLKPTSNFSSNRGKPHNPITKHRGGGSGGGGSMMSRVKGTTGGGGGGAVGKFGKKAFSGSNRKRGKANPANQRGGGRSKRSEGYRGYFNHKNVTLQSMENNENKGKEEGEENKVILVSAKDEFCTYQDICSMCGAFGQDQEGRLIGCAQCGQCYHPYCANVKVNKVVLEKGWRCLDCTVCEGCGERNDEGRLVLCEDCDISFHIYCMNPPLDTVPSGVWKCKWCAVCQYCKATDAGPNSTWKQNFSMCGPCHSIQQCPVCEDTYGEGELIIQCGHCDRWLHASDDMIQTEEEAERCAEKGYVCVLCRPHDALPAHKLPVTPPVKTPIRTSSISGDSILKPMVTPPVPTVSTTATATTPTTPTASPAPTLPVTPTTATTTITATTSNISPSRPTSPESLLLSPVNNKPNHYLDGIYLSESGLFHINSLTLEPVKKPRNHPRNIHHRGRSLDSRGSRDVDDDNDDEDDYRMEIDEPKHWVYGMKEGTVLQAKDDGTPPDLPEGFYTLPGPEHGTYTLRKRRYRNIKTLGIGGFQVRARGKKEEERLKEEAAMDPQVLELRRKRSNWRTKKKIKLLEKFPSYMQEAFFGRNLMDTSNLEEEIRNIGVIDEESDEDVYVPQPLPKFSIKLTKDEIELVDKAQAKKDQTLNPSISPRNRSHKRKKKTGSQNVNNAKGKADEEEDENNVNKAIDEIFSGGLFSDGLVDDIMNEDMKSDNSNNEDEEDDLDGTAVVGGGMRVSDILGPGFNLNDVRDIMKDLPEDGMEDSRDSTSASPSAASRSNIVSTNRHITTTNGASSLVKAGEGKVIMAPGTPKTGIVAGKSSQSPLSTSTPLSAHQLGSKKLAEASENLKDVGGNATGTQLPRLNQPPVAPLGSLTLSSPLPGHNTLPGQSPLVGPSTMAGQQQQAPPQSLPGLRTLHQHQHQPGKSPLPPHSSLPGQSPLPEHAVTLTSQSQVPGLNTLPGQSHLPGQPGKSQLPGPNTLPAGQSQLPGPNTSLPGHSTLPGHPPHLPSAANNNPSLIPSHSTLPGQQSVLSGPRPHPHPPIQGSLSRQPSSLPILPGAPAAALSGQGSGALPGPLHPSLSQVTSLPPGASGPPLTTGPAGQPLIRPGMPSPTAGNLHSPGSLKSPSSGLPSPIQGVLQQSPTVGVGHPSPSTSMHNTTAPNKPTNVVTSTFTEPQKTTWNGNDSQSQSLSLEEDESLGSKATKAAVLYVNVNKPNIMTEYPSIADRERYIKGVWKKLDSEQRKIYIQKARDNKKEYYKNKQEQQRILKQSDSCESNSNSATSSPQHDSPSLSGGLVITPPMTSPRPQLPSLLNTRPQGGLVQQRPQLVSSVMGHTIVMRPPHSQSDPYASMPGTPRPSDSLPPGTPRPINSLSSGPGAPHRPGGPQDPYASMPGTPRPPPTNDPYAMPPPTPRPIDPYTNQNAPPGATPTSESFGPGDTFSQGPRTGYVQAPGTPRPHDDSYQPSTPQPPSISADPARQQHLRELLQRQQQPPRGWSEGGVVPQPHSSPNAPGGPFRQPLPPMISGQPVRIRPPGGKPGTILSHTSTANQMDPRFRQIIQHSIAQPGGPQRQSPQPGSPLDPYNHLVQQRAAQYNAGGIVGHIVRSPGTVMVSQGMGSPLLQPQGSPLLQPQGSPHLITPPHVSPTLLPHQLQQQQQQMLIQQNMESELPEAVTRELEQLEEMQEQQQQQNNNTNTGPVELVPGDLTTMEDDDLLAIGGDFNALLEFADGEDEIEDCKEDEDKFRTPFDDLDEDAIASGLGMTNRRKGVPGSSGGTVIGKRSTMSGQSSNSSTPTPPNMVPVGPSSGGQPVGPPPGPIMGPVPRMILSNVPGAQPTQPLMAPQLTSTQGGITRILGAPPGAMIRQAGLPPPPYPGQPPPPYPRAQEQPLLIEDLLEQEKMEQLKQHKASEQQQGQQGGLSTDELNLSDMDFEKLKADVMARDNAGLNQSPGAASGVVGIRPGFQRIPGQPGVVSPVQPMTRPVRPPMTQGDPGLHPALLQAGSRVVVPSSPGTVTIKTLPPPPVPPDNPQTDTERQQQSQYEYWLSQQHNLIATQQRHYETEITKLRKQRKSLNSRQRTMKKNGQELSEHDASELERVQREAAIIQRSLDQCRKSGRQHTMIIQEYNNKKKQRPQMIGHHGVVIGPQGPGGMMSGNSPMGPSGSSPMHSTPHSPLMSPSPSSQSGMGMSPMGPSPHTPVASPNTIAVPQHSPHSMVIPVPHPSPGDSPYSPHQQVRMPSPSFQDQGPRPGFPGPGMPHHMIPQGMRIRMPVLSPGSQHVQPGQMSPHMMRPIYQQQPGGPGPMMTQGQGGPMMMRHQYAPQGVVPLRRPSGSGPVLSPSPQGPISSPGGPVPSPLGGQGFAMKPSPVHSGLTSPVPLASPSPGGPIPSPHTIGMTNKPSPVHSGLRSPVPMASPSQIRPHSVENPSTPLTPRSASGDGYPHTPGSAGGSQVNSPSNNTIPSPAGTPRPASASSAGGGGGNANNPNNPAPLPPHFGRFGFFKLGLRGGMSNGVMVKSRWGHFKIGLKGGSPLGEIENNAVSVSGGTVITQTTTTSLSTIAATTMTTSASRMKLSSLENPTFSPSSNSFSNNNAIQEENQEGLAHVLSESLKSPQVRLPMMTTPSMTRVHQMGGMSTSFHNPVSTSYALSNPVTIPEPQKSEIPPSSRHQAMIGIPGGGSVQMTTSYSNLGTVSVAPGVTVPAGISSTSYNYPTSSTGGIVTNSSTSWPTSLGINPGSIPQSIISANTGGLSKSVSTPSSVTASTGSVDVSTLSTILGNNDQVNSLPSIAASRPVTAMLHSTSATTHTTSSLGRPVVSVPIQHLQDHQQQIQQHHPQQQQFQPQPHILQRQLSQGGQPMMTTVSQVRTLPSVGQIQQGTQQIRMLAAPQPGMQQISTSSLQQQQGGEPALEQGGPQAIQQHLVQQTLGPGQQLVQTTAGVLVQNSAGQTVRMMGQPVMVQQMVRAGNVMVRGPSGGQVAVQGRQIMMIHGGQQVRTPSPPVTRGPVMMPPPIGKSPAGQSASPIPRVSPSPSPLSNLPSPHSPQLKGQSPLMGSPAPSPHGSHSTPPGMIKRDPDERLGSSPQSGSPQLGPNSTTSLPSMTFPYLSQSLNNQIKTEAGQIEPQKETPTSQNALLKQLLQNTACASSIQQQQGGQLVLVRSPQTNLPVASQHLSQIASQVPNPTPIVIPRNSVGGPHQPGSVQQVQAQGQIIGQTSTGPVRMVPQQVVVSGQPGQPGQTVVIGHPGQPHQQQLLTQGTTRPMFVSQHQPQQGMGETQQHPSSQQQHPPGTLVRQVSQGHPGGHPGLPSIPGGHQLVHSGSMVTHGPPSNHLSHQSGSPVLHHTLRPGHPGTPLPAGHPVSSVGHIGRTGPTPASMADRISRDPGLKTEMQVMIPETVLGSGGPSTGDLTPEMTTPNDDYHGDDEFKRAKKRQAQQARRKSQSKEPNKIVAPAKRPRQGSRLDEDYDVYIDGVMQQLRAMPPLTITEPSVPRNFNLCPVFGSGDLIKLGRKDYDCRQGVLVGTPGNFTLKNQTDYYSTQPFGPEVPRVTPAKTGPTQRGFYIHEFTPPKIGLPLDELPLEHEATTIVNPNMGSNRPTPTQTPTSMRDADSPDTVLSSSSPECVLPESPPPFKGLRLIDMDEDPQDDHRDRSISPSIPLLVPTPIRPGQLPFMPVIKKEKDAPEMDKENLPHNIGSIMLKNRVGLTPALPLKDMGNVNVTLTLSSQAGDDISNVLRNLANLLNIPPPSTYHMIEKSLENNNIPKLFHHKHPKDGKEQVVEIQSILNGQASFCKNCSLIIMKDKICKKLSEMPVSTKDGNVVDDITFCTQECMLQYVITHKVEPKPEKPRPGCDGRGRLKDEYNSEDSSEDDLLKDDELDQVLKVPKLEDGVRGRPVKHKLDDMDYYPRQSDGKRFRGHTYHYWTPNSLPMPEKIDKPTPKEMTDTLFRMAITYRKPRLKEDHRQCVLCNLYGDSVADGPSRLLNYEVNKWVHLNCALWCEDVYETMNGALMNVENSIKKASGHICEHCEQPGASTKCFKVRCCKTYHLNCAVKEGCTFYKNKTVYCQEHANKGEKENELLTLAVYRRVFIDREDNRQMASVIRSDEDYVFRTGSLYLQNIGQLLPNQLQAFHSPFCIYPVGYQMTRFYWSMRKLHKRCAYECSISDKEGQPEFQITVIEDGFEDLTLTSCSPKGVWTKILEPLTEMRQKGDVVRLFPQYISGEDLFGLTEPAVVRILESLPGVDTLSDYNFKYGRNPLFEMPLAINPTGTARSEPFNKNTLKRYTHGHNTGAGTVRTASTVRNAAAAASLALTLDPFISFEKLHKHSISSQYKKMKQEWRSNVYLARSKIAGLGLYAARDIEKNTFLVEYIGEVIRAELSNIRERRYESQNRGIYMFRLDDARVVDASETGGLARYVNHSCGPNCYTKTVEAEGDQRILIISNRKILRGEELSYDYKFDEEDESKIPCLCGAENCRKWMN